MSAPVRSAVADVDTPHGPARTHTDRARRAAGLLVLGHGAGGGVDTPDLLAVRDVAVAGGFTVVRVEQPYRVAGRRGPAPPRQLDAAWCAVLGALGPAGPLVVGGRSSGARVACRTAAGVGAAGVLCLAFPLMPPAPARPVSRAPELAAVELEVLVVQGERDRFGRPEPAARREVAVVAGDHGLRHDPGAVARAVGRWLARFGPAA